jgi:hypothetical protein
MDSKMWRIGLSGGLPCAIEGQAELPGQMYRVDILLINRFKAWNRRPMRRLPTFRSSTCPWRSISSMIGLLSSRASAGLSVHSHRACSGASELHFLSTSRSSSEKRIPYLDTL